MNLNTKLEVAVDIMSTMIARVANNSENFDEEILQNLLYEREEMYKSNEEVLDKIINVYGKILKEEING